MKRYKKIRIFLSTCIAGLAAVFCGVLFSSVSSIDASAETTLAGYKTDGSSVRIYELDDEGNYNDTTRKGIRFHVEMPMDSVLNGDALIPDSSVRNERNGSFKMAEGIKTYTLVIPTSKLSGADLTKETPSVMKLDTTEYWFQDKAGNAESVAYVYGLPQNHYTTSLSFRGIICSVDENGKETLLASTEVSERSMASVAKLAYKDTESGAFSWGNEERNKDALGKIKEYIPIYNVTYDVAGATTTEEVWWGDAPKKAPTGDFNTWYNEDSSEEIDVTQEMTYATSQNITLTSTTANTFTLTGAECTSGGIKIYATLPIGKFADGAVLDGKAIDVTYVGEGTYSGINKVYVVNEQTYYTRLVFQVDDSTFKNGDKLTVKDSSIFYYDGVMYKLAKDYTFEYSKTEAAESYEVFLGYLYNSDIKSVENYQEDRNGDGDKTDHQTIRVTFRKNLLINGDFHFEQGEGNLPADMPYPVFIRCGKTGVEQVENGYYYWNDGEHTILELNAYGHHTGEELFAAAGTKLVQNGGYYIFVDRMYAYLPDGESVRWVSGRSAGTISLNEFGSQGTNFVTSTGEGEIRITTTTQWGLYDANEDGVRETWMPELVGKHLVDCVMELMPDENGVYGKAIYTAADGTEQELKYFRYYFGQDTNDGAYQILALENVSGKEAGDKIFISGGTRFWMGQYYYTLTEDLNMYYNGVHWVMNSDGTAEPETISGSNFTRVYNYLEDGVEYIRLNLDVSLFNELTGGLIVETKAGTGIYLNGQLWTGMHYHGSTHKILELRGEGLRYGTTPFEDTLVIKKGTRIWMGNVCHEFEEEIKFVFLGKDQTQTLWALENVMEILPEDVILVQNYNNESGVKELRIRIGGGIIGSHYGWAVINEDKGLPIINGVTMAAETAFTYGSANNLLGILGGEFGESAGDYLYIPAGSEWWTTQGRIVFPEAICAVYMSNNWFVANNDLGDLTSANFSAVRNDGDNEIRMFVPGNIMETHYKVTGVYGDVVLEKANGSVLRLETGFWYGGNSEHYNSGVDTNGEYTSIFGLRGTGFAGSANGDVLRIPAGTKIIYGLPESNTSIGYKTITEELVYTYVNGAWVVGDLRVAVTFNGNHVTANGATTALQGGYSFTLTPDDGYAISKITVNGDELATNANHAYTITLTGDTVIEITTVSTASVCAVTFNVPNGVTVENGAVANGSTVYVENGGEYTFSVALENGCRLVSVEGAVANGDGTYTLTVTENVTVTIKTINVWSVTYSLGDATASIGGVSVTSGATITVDEGVYTVAITANDGYAIVGVTNAVNNYDGTYTVNVNANMTVAVTTKQSIKLTAESIISISNEGDPSGVRIKLNESQDSKIAELLGVNNYGMTINGKVTVTIGGELIGVWADKPYNYFGDNHDKLEIRFDTANLSVGDEFVIKAGTVFNHANLAYALEFTEDVVGVWTGSAWIVNPTKAGDLDWNKIKNVVSHSDYNEGVATTHTIRIHLNEELFNGATNVMLSEGTVTVNGSAYTGVWRYHGNGNKIVELSEWSYAKDDVLVIEAGTRLYMRKDDGYYYYYVTTNTLTATCTADGHGAVWTWTVS